VKYYPVYLDLRGRRCVVVGGGEVAERKVRRLLDSGAEVFVTGKDLTEGLKDMKREGKLRHIEADYGETHIEGAFLVIGATDSREVNEAVCRDAHKKGILVNIVDDPVRCDFLLPSLFERGDLQIAVSTGGKSPALARKLRQDMEGIFGPEYRILLDIMGELRKKILSRGYPASENRKLFESVVYSEVLQSIRNRDWRALKKRIHDLTGEDIDDLERYE